MKQGCGGSGDVWRDSSTPRGNATMRGKATNKQSQHTKGKAGVHWEAASIGARDRALSVGKRKSGCLYDGEQSKGAGQVLGLAPRNVPLPWMKGTKKGERKPGASILKLKGGVR